MASGAKNVPHRRARFAYWKAQSGYLIINTPVVGSDRTQTAIIAHYAVSNAKHLTVDHV